MSSSTLPFADVPPEPLVVATDGSALGNPGPGGWSWFVSPTNWAAGFAAHTTNNIMELTALLDLLESTEPSRPLKVMIDSQYVINCVTKWIHGWKRRNWVASTGKPVANRELIEAIDRAMAGRAVELIWVRGHAGHSLNEEADTLAREAAGRAKRSGTDGRYSPLTD